MTTRLSADQWRIQTFMVESFPPAILNPRPSPNLRRIVVQMYLLTMSTGLQELATEMFLLTRGRRVSVVGGGLVWEGGGLVWWKEES